MSAESHTTEFDAPPSAISPARPEKRHYSIDLSLELERQLDMESQPPTPAPHPPPPQPHVMQMPDIDPHVLAHIISQLRNELRDMTKERDDLLVLLSAAHTKEAELEDALQHITDKAMALDEALSDSRKKNRDDEEAIAMLRTKVEESRRGLMRLQAESRRQPMTLDTNRANAPSAFISPPSSKRASFTPLTGSFAPNTFAGRPNGHRRISSVSDSNINLAVPDADSAVAVLIPNRRMSGFFGRSSPPRDSPPQPSMSPDEAEKLRKELRAAQAALEETRGELSEATEAREASETCVSALREFIAENNIGGPSAAVKLPPLPAATTGGEEADTSGGQKKEKGWGFKLWKVDTAVKGPPGPPSSNGTASPIVPPAALPPASNNTTATAPAPSAPLARKLTGFFSSRASISSIPSLTPAPLANAHRDSVYSVSDASSLAEPISPTSVSGGGAEVRVRDANASPEISGSPEVRGAGGQEVKVPMQMQEADDVSLRSVGI
ncbi:hypothetical protein DFH07DRAFT_889484 [Mycena maculata]|uniref:Uncharacterized protein n=1 Tax=Mycena maculata TaxID=230809 RepID=A0AAD7INN4_9AGAR|nr:hypothetical protein DFH07DRAFT_889484 [Mycena maculata]